MASAVELLRAYVQAHLVDRDALGDAPGEVATPLMALQHAQAGLHHRRGARSWPWPASARGARSIPSGPSAPAATAQRKAEERPARAGVGGARNGRPRRRASPSRDRPRRGQRARVPRPASAAPGELLLDEVQAVPLPAARQWPATCAGTPRGIFGEIDAGLRAAGERARARGRPVRASAWTAGAWTTASSTRDGRLLEDPVCYRDARTDGVMAQVVRARPARRDLPPHRHPVPRLQHALPARAHRREGLPAAASRLLLIPDLVPPSASPAAPSPNTRTRPRPSSSTRTTATGTARSASASGCPRRCCPSSCPPGPTSARSRPRARRRAGRSRASRVVAPATHDTASAVAGAPLAAGLGLHLLGHLVARRASSATAPLVDRGGGARELHERGRRLRHRPVPQERDGPLDPRARAGREWEARRPRGRTAGRCSRAVAALDGVAGPRLPRRPAASSTRRA